MDFAFRYLWKPHCDIMALAHYSLSIHLRTGKFGNLILDDFTSLELCCFLCCSSLRVVLGKREVFDEQVQYYFMQ